MKTWTDVYNELQPIEQEIVDNLAELCEQLKPQRILEIGTGWGMSLRTFIQYAPTASIITIDKIPPPDRQGYVARTEGYTQNVKQIIGDAKVEVPKIEGLFDLIYIDGSHDYIDVITDLRNALPKIMGGGVIIMDDVLHAHNESDYGVLKAFREFVMDNPKVFSKIVIRPYGHGQAYLYV